jgi:apolipoprotein D and lipocalin family protein
MPKWSILAAALTASLLAACSTTPSTPLVLAQPIVDVNRFAGDWYVIGTIPRDWEGGAHNAKETYTVKPNGSMEATFTYRADSSDGALKWYRSVAYPVGPGNVVWGQHYLWPVDLVIPFDFDYRIAYLSPDYTQAVIARGERDYVWILSRTPKIADADYQGLLNFVGKVGYDVSLVQRVPQSDAN